VAPTPPHLQRSCAFALQHLVTATIIEVYAFIVKTAISAISSATATQTSGVNNALQAALQLAKRAANQARTNAQALETQASNAQSTASDGQNYAQSLTTEANQAQLNVDFTQQNLTAVETASQLDSGIATAVNNVVTPNPIQATTSTAPPNLPVVNAQG
jgi:hypothetical protein